MRIGNRQIDSLIKIVAEQTGTDLSGYRRPALSRRISERLARLGRDAEQYLSMCAADPDECHDLIGAVAINVSSFFRNPATFEMVAQTVLPKLAVRGGELRVWSAGCAAGEEAYSMAILIREQLEKTENTRTRPVIFATDVDRGVLTKARKALYPRESLKDAKLGIVDTYFSHSRDTFELCDEVKKMVHFSYDDLLSQDAVAPAASIYGSFDVILCRNVLIYFSEELQEQIFKKFHKALARGGYLVLGNSETICPNLRSRFKTIDAKNKIYQK